MSWLTFLAMALRVTSPDSPSATSNSPSQCFSSLFLLTYEKCVRRQPNREEGSGPSSVISFKSYLWLPIHLLNHSFGDKFVGEFVYLLCSFLWASAIEGLKRGERRGSKLHFVTSELPQKVGHRVSVLFKIWWAQEVSISTVNTFWKQCLWESAKAKNSDKVLPAIRIYKIFSRFFSVSINQASSPHYFPNIICSHCHSFCCSPEHRVFFLVFFLWSTDIYWLGVVHILCNHTGISRWGFDDL